MSPPGDREAATSQNCCWLSIAVLPVYLASQALMRANREGQQGGQHKTSQPSDILLFVLCSFGKVYKAIKGGVQVSWAIRIPFPCSSCPACRPLAQCQGSNDT